MNKPYPGLGSSVLVLGLALAAQAAAGWLWMRLLNPGLDLVVLSGAANLTALTVAVALAFWRSGEAPRFSPGHRVRRGLAAAVALSAAGGTVVLGEAVNLTAWLVPLPPELEALFDRLTGAPLPSALFTLVLVAPLTEEALFRGLLLRGFARRYGPAAGLLMSSALFALFHLNLWQALAAFAAGFYLGWLYLATGSLLYPMAAHAVFNGLPVVLTAVGLTVPGYNTPPSAGAGFQPWPWTLTGAAVLGLGLELTRRWAPLSPRKVSDTLGE